MTESLQNKVLRIRDLPTIPIVITKIIGVVQDEKSDAKDLVKIIENDLSLTSKILRIANSAYYGQRGQVSSIIKATVLLGFELVKNLSITISVINAFNDNIENCYFNLKKFWTHSIGVGVASQLIAKECEKKEMEMLFTLGIIHDLGKLIFISLSPEEYKKALDLVQEEGISIRQAEEKIFGIDHTIVGSWVSRKWNLPEIFTNIIKNHHKPIQNTNNATENAILYLANSLCKDLKIGHSGDYVPASLSPSLLNMIHINTEQLTLISLTLEKEKDNIHELIGAII
ncbi:MAG: HDOD domain-containing protein [bacterium]